MNIVHNWPAAGIGATGGASGSGSRALSSTGQTAEVVDWLLAGLVLASLWWTTLHLGGYWPAAMPVTVTLNALAVVVWLTRPCWQDRWLNLSPALLGTLPFLLYAGINAAWLSPVPWLAWRDWLGWMQMAALFAVVSQGIRRPAVRMTLFWGLVALGVVAVAMAGYQRLADPRRLMLGRHQAAQFLGRSSGPFGIPNSLAAFLNLLVPPLLALTLRRGAGAVARLTSGYLAALLLGGLWLTLSRGAWLALGAALVAWPLLVGRDRRRRWYGALGVAALLVVAAAVVYLRDAGAQARVDVLLRHPIEPSRAVMWRAAWNLFLEHPATGSGAGSYGILFERHRPERFWDAPQWAHNDYLNTLSDYGALGFLLSFGVLAAAGAIVVKALRRVGAAATAGPEPLDSGLRALQVGLAMGVLAFALQLVVDFNLKIPALAQAAAVMAGLLATLLPPSGTGHIPRGIRLPWIVPAGTALAVLLALPLQALPLYRAEGLRHSARAALDRLAIHPPGAPEAARRLLDASEQLRRAVQIDPSNAAAWSDLADALIQQSRLTPQRASALGREAEVAATHALERSPAVAEFWLHRGLALDLQGRWRDAWADFARALALAPRRGDIWYYYAYHLSLRDLESAKAALATCLSLDPSNGPALAFQKELGGSH